MKKTTVPLPRLILNIEHLRRITAGGEGDALSPLDVTSNISARSSCQGTQYCCKPP